MLIGLSLLDPLGGVGQDIVGWIGRSISQGIGGFASWAIGGVIHAMQSTTTPDFTSWFEGPWRAMLTVVAWLSVPILFIGVGTAALRGDLTSVLKRGLGAPVIMAIGTAVALPVTAGVLTLVNACCSLLVNLALGGNQGFGQGLDHLSNFALSATVTTGGSSLPGLAAALIIALAGLAALVIWFVLALRGALLYLEVLAIPLALIGLYWGGTAHWIKRLVDLIIATILSQLVITMLMVLAAADLNSGQLSGTNPGAVGGDMTTLFLCLAFLILGSLALPMALRHVPAATEHAAATAAMISAPGRMTYMGSRVAGTAKMMGGSGGQQGPGGSRGRSRTGWCRCHRRRRCGGRRRQGRSQGGHRRLPRAPTRVWPRSPAGSDTGASGTLAVRIPADRCPAAPLALATGRTGGSQAEPGPTSGRRKDPASTSGSPGGSGTPGPVGESSQSGRPSGWPIDPEGTGRIPWLSTSTLYNFGVLTKRYELVSRTAGQLAPGVLGAACGFVMVLGSIPMPLPFVPVLLGFWFALGRVPFGRHRGTKVRSLVGSVRRYGLLRANGRARWEMPQTWRAVGISTVTDTAPAPANGPALTRPPSTPQPPARP